MKQESMKILFFIRKSRLTKNGEAPIFLRVEKPRDFDPFGQTGFAHLWLQYN